MGSRNFAAIAKEQFSFLIDEYSCKLIECLEKDWGYNLVYKNKTTYIKIMYEYREAYILITLYKLVPCIINTIYLIGNL